jgi:hypothetical protein
LSFLGLSLLVVPILSNHNAAMQFLRAIRLGWCGVAALVFAGCESAISTPAKTTYVDATDGPAGNTRFAIGEEFIAQGSPLIGNDNLWSKRREGNGGSVFTTNDGRPSGPEDGAMLVTTISGLTAGARYRVFAYFWADQHNWQLKASLTPIEPPGDDPAISFSKEGTPMGQVARRASANDFAAPVIDTEANRHLMQAELGDTVADANGEIAVWIDDFPNAGHSNRTWYDGVGVLPLPTPAAFRPWILLAFIMAAILAAILYVIVSIYQNRQKGKLEEFVTPA